MPTLTPRVKEVLSVLTLTTISVFAAASPPKPYISSFSYSGNGCPKDSVTVLFTNNGSTLMTIFEGTNMQPAAGPGVSFNDKMKRCTVQTKLDLEPGWQVRVNARGSDVHGDMVLDKELNYMFLARYSVDDTGGPMTSAKVEVAGPHYPGEFSEHADSSGSPPYGNCNGSSELINSYSSSLVALLSSAFTGDVDPDGGPWVVETTIDVVECK